ncbi:metalloenzyme [Actinomycetospora sp. NBRC 106375]|uniref:sulfatase-like hydrolase/transferase n=1 Tax=Actinomycetospora sp. NBRC 106375 TaxID=3032207 RepID=UPI0024A0B8BC|nr:sulfatase-like hydrolase/transferase [Actinomycetospora sp. NBRC 106375]GLZ50071.1 metalloenzyme [Actinomycetospora sp. NBRC 106375]
MPRISGTADAAAQVLASANDVLSRNIVLITVDSCRFDTAVAATTPNLDTVGGLRRAQTYGSFTLPAHAAIFAGFLPNVRDDPDEDFYSKERRQLWRLASARHPARPRHLVSLDGPDILAGFRALGYRTIGAGGVRWFSRGALPALFDEFHYWGPDNDAHDKFAPRSASSFALTHASTLASRARHAGRYFLFVNAAETHAPYTLDDDGHVVDEILRRWAGHWNGAAGLPATSQRDADMRILHGAQVEALEAVDSRIGSLLNLLAGRLLVVVCGDHGEAFGEDGLWGHDFPAEQVMSVPMWIGCVDTRFSGA